MTTARKEVLEYLQRTQVASADEIARGLCVGVADIRHHLRILLADGRVEAVGSTQPDARGRPKRLYAIRLAARGENLGALAGALLGDLLEGLPEHEKTEAMRRIGIRLAESFQPVRLHLSKQLAEAVDRLTLMGYQARWEAGATGPRLVLGNCPYAKLINEHPELCQMDLALLEVLMARPVAQVARLEGGPASGPGHRLPFCIFSVLGS
ncbi:MAG: hypothetical protein JXA13_04880 [Anaerolineales bacterium]|nr:hypothetical protein [Anaerolineales bacterium]